MELSWITDLGHLARTGNFSRAAELSNISQPAFSRRIKAVEAWVGVTLVDRSKQPVRLTNAGAQILEAGQQAIERLETERREVQETERGFAGHVATFGAQHAIAWRFYPAWLQDLEADFGPFRSRLRADDLPSCARDLQAGDTDFVLAYVSEHNAGVERVPGLEALTIGRDRLSPVCRPDHDGRPLYPIDAGDAEIPFLRYGGDAPISWHLTPLLARTGLKARLRCVYENAMSNALQMRARDGAGVAWLPHSLVAPDLEAGALVAAGGAAWEVPLTIRLHRMRGRANSLTRGIWSHIAAAAAAARDAPTVPSA